MSSSPSFCGMCDNRHISKPSEAWCRECEEGLCTECTEYHSSVKLSRSHTTKNTVYTVKNMSVHVAVFVSWKIIKTVKRSLFLKI